VDSGSSGGIWIDLDSNDYPHMSYHVSDGINQAIKYAEWTGSTWSTKTVESMTNNMYSPSIVLDSNDLPHITYIKAPGLDIKYAYWTGSGWSVETIDTIGDASSCISLALDKNQNPHVCYNHWNGGKNLRYAQKKNGYWNIQIVDSNEWVGKYNSLTLDSKDCAHISYSEEIKETLKYTKWVLPNTLLPSICIYPNPFVPSENSQVTFRLTADMKVEIYTLSAEIVKELTDEDGDGQIEWDGRNSTGQNVASGVYIVLAITPNNEKKTGKLAIIR